MTHNQEIKCTVSNCKFHSDNEHCTLGSITVGCEGEFSQARSDRETVCCSFSKK